MMRRFFLKRLQKYFMYMMIPTLLIFVMSLGILFMTASTSLSSDGKKTVEAVKTNMELVISNVLTQNDMITGSTRMSMAMQDFLLSEEMSYSDSVYLSSLKAIWKSITVSHEYIDSIYLYLDSGELYFSSQSGILTIGNSEDTTWYQHYFEMDKEQNEMAVVRTIGKDTVAREVISIYKRLLLQDGCFIVNINAEKFGEMFEVLRSNENEKVCLLDKNGEILLWGDTIENEAIDITSDFFVKLMGDRELETALKEYENSGWGIIGKRWLIQSEKYNVADLYIVSVMPGMERFRYIQDILWVYLLIFVSNFFIVMGIAYVITRRTFRQIDYMIEVFDNAEKGIFEEERERKVNDEYDVIMNNVIHMFINNSYLKMQLSERKYRLESAELKALQLQINPHFLFNTLQSVEMEISSVLGINNDASRIVKDISDILKYSMRSANDRVSLGEEITYLKKYVEIQKFRFGSKFIIYYEIDDEAVNTQVFKLMLQPVVENSILHGVRNISRQGYIKVKVQLKNDELYCTVLDNGEGMNKAQIEALYQKIEDENSESIGLTNVNRRLILTYGSGSALKIQSKEGRGTIVSFKIPCEQQSKNL